MDFEIRFPNGHKVPMNTLNAEAANLWGVNLKSIDEEYVSPNPLGEVEYGNLAAWPDVIGLAITTPELVGVIPMQQNWKGVRETLFNSQMKSGNVWALSTEELVQDIQKTALYLKPFYELIDLWESKGYIPIRIKS